MRVETVQDFCSDDSVVMDSDTNLSKRDRDSKHTTFSCSSVSVTTTLLTLLLQLSLPKCCLWGMVIFSVLPLLQVGAMLPFFVNYCPLPSFPFLPLSLPSSSLLPPSISPFLHPTQSCFLLPTHPPPTLQSFTPTPHSLSLSHPTLPPFHTLALPPSHTLSLLHTHTPILLYLLHTFPDLFDTGWLIKEGSVRRKWFFVLTENQQLYYYRSEDTRQPMAGHITLNR